MKTTILSIAAVVALSTTAFGQSYSQRDGRWANQKLGNSNYTIGGYGCALTCNADLLYRYGIRTDPSESNNWGRAHGGFSGALVVWNAFAKRVGRTAYKYDWSNRAADIATLRRLVSQKPIIVETRFNHVESQTHYVLLVGFTPTGDFLTADPWYGDYVGFTSRYGNAPRWIYSAIEWR